MALVSVCVNQECVLLISHSVHALLSNNRLQDDVIILDMLPLCVHLLDVLQQQPW